MGHIVRKESQSPLLLPPQVQCVMHFLQMPIEDELVDELLPRQPPGVLLDRAGPVLAPDVAPIPFADVGNPVMAQVPPSQQYPGRLLLARACVLACHTLLGVRRPACRQIVTSPINGIAS